MAALFLVLGWVAYLAWLATTDTATRQTHLVVGWGLLLLGSVLALLL
jgi:hypothetical protein